MKELNFSLKFIINYKNNNIFRLTFLAIQSILINFNKSRNILKEKISLINISI